MSQGKQTNKNKNAEEEKWEFIRVGEKQWWAGQEEAIPSASLLVGQQQDDTSVAVSQFSLDQGE